MTDQLLSNFIDLANALDREVKALRKERVQLQAENESLRADLRTAAIDFGMWLTTRPTVIEVGAPVSVYAMNEALQEYETLPRFQGKVEDPATARDKTDVEVLAERLAKVEDRLARLDPAGWRPPLTPEQRDTFGRGDEVRLDMAQSQGGRRLFGWYVVEGIGSDPDGYSVQVSATEKRDDPAKGLFWIKPEDVLEVRKPTR
jgi:hypothetical protein